MSDLKELNICCRCVEETYLRDQIKANGLTAECSYCGEVASSAKLSELAEWVEKAFEQLYVRVSDESGDNDWLLQGEGEPVVNAIMDAAKIPEEAATDVQQILAGEHSSFEAMTMSEETEFADGSSYKERDTSIQSWWDIWSAFEKSLKTEARYFSGPAASTLTAIFAGIDSMRSVEGRPLVVDAGPGTEHTSFFRAREFPTDEALHKALCRPDIELGSPPANLARAGRMNALGISVFYGSSRTDVAISEVRPPVGCKVAVGRFEITRNLQLLDLTALSKATQEGSIFDLKYSAELERVMFLRTLSHEIVKPILPDDQAFDYLPTQAITEFLAAGTVSNLDGILFPSVQAEDDALNVVLFHKAARVATLQIPEGAEIESSDGHFNGQDYETYYTVCEAFPSGKPEAADAANDGSFSHAVDITGKLLKTIDNDSREPSLRIDTTKIDVHYVQKVKIKTKSFEVIRHRTTKSETSHF